MSLPTARLSLSATQRLMLKGIGLFVLAGVGGLALANPPLVANSDGPRYTGTVDAMRAPSVPAPVEPGVRDLTQLEFQRAAAIAAYAAQYALTPELAALIYDTAHREGIDPELGFRVVKIESNFRPNARSSAGAIGLAQVMLPTAVFYDRTITAERLTDPETNLWIGFRYLRYLLERYEWDLRLALLAYNRGPARVGDLLARGIEPGNGYARAVTSGYRPVGPTP
ncbi:MAG: transglycosylase SLT domain-containing protein [Gemmatimonadales bacterium]